MHPMVKIHWWESMQVIAQKKILNFKKSLKSHCLQVHTSIPLPLLQLFLKFSKKEKKMAFFAWWEKCSQRLKN